MAEGARRVTAGPRRATRAPGKEMAVFLAAFEQAGRGTQIEERRPVICGQRLLLRVAGEAMLEPQTASLAHHPQWQGGEPDLTVSMWDTASTRVALPETSRPPAGDGRVLASYNYGNSGLSLLEPASRSAGYWLPDAAVVSNHDRASPLRVVLNWWLGGKGIQLVHCAGVGTTAGAAAIVGRGGSGKSTTSLACLDAGLGFFGDDYCAVNLQSRPPRMLSLYGLAKLAPESLARLPQLRSEIVHPESIEDGKYLLNLNTRFGGQFLDSTPLRAILVPQLSGGDTTRFSPARPLAALTALAPSTLVQAPARADSLALMRDMVAAVPCFDMALGSDVREVADAISRFLEHLEPGSRE
jgi:hypothetical protein